ncbi:hypothetical protein [Candidatus Electrothrix sp.]|uniref:hypothetical protein n=1 Tax=Candidatus Electrothrix sp. TaxID=2170559 RepID=UPI00405716E0
MTRTKSCILSFCGRTKSFFFASALLFVPFIFSGNALAVPAAPIEHELTQPDGSKFKARKWGDEWNHGWETVKGYTIKGC